MTVIASLVRNPFTIAGMVLALNVPFGYWRFASRRMSLPWFFAIHLPVALAIGLRWLIGVHFRWLTLPLYVGAFVAGQTAGGRLRRRSARNGGRSGPFESRPRSPAWFRRTPPRDPERMDHEP